MLHQNENVALHQEPAVELIELSCTSPRAVVGSRLLSIEEIVPYLLYRKEIQINLHIGRCAYIQSRRPKPHRFSKHTFETARSGDNCLDVSLFLDIEQTSCICISR